MAGEATPRGLGDGHPADDVERDVRDPVDAGDDGEGYQQPAALRDIDSVLRQTFSGTPIHGVKVWRSWTIEGEAVPEVLEESIRLIRCETQAEAAELALAESRRDDDEFVNEAGDKVVVRTLGVEFVFSTNAARAVSGLEVYAYLHDLDDDGRGDFGPPASLWPGR